MKKLIQSLGVVCLLTIWANAQTDDYTANRIEVRFDQVLREWDGFGVNYVEVRHTRDYQEFQQDYGGFKYLDQQKRQEIIQLVFGEDGLKPAIVKMFADPFMEIENDNDDPFDLNLNGFDHTTTTKWMRYFASEGLKETRKWGGDLVFLAGIYGPPAFTTKQKELRGRDLDPAKFAEVAEFIVAWAKYLREKEGFNVKYISMHNEGEDKNRWTEDGGDHYKLYAHDYNMWWPDHQIADFLKIADEVLYHNNMLDIKLTTGETTSWKRLYDFVTKDGIKSNIANAIAEDQEAMKNLGLITSHGFEKAYDGYGADILRKKNPGLHTWTTSYTWGEMDIEIIEEARRLIYDVKCNGLIPWATVHNRYESDKLSPPRDVRVSSNPSSPIFTSPDGEFEISKAYYHFKQISRAGQSGMYVAGVNTNNDQIQAMAFAQNRTINPDAFVIINKNDNAEAVEIKVVDSSFDRFHLFCTSDRNFSDLNYKDLGIRILKEDTLQFTAPASSVTTFFGINKYQ